MSARSSSDDDLQSPADIEDPMMRLISWVRHGFGASAVGRNPGEFSKPEADTAEPERTERLLASPFTLFHSNAGDAYDALCLFLLSRSTGKSRVGIFYDFSCYLVLHVSPS